MEVQAGDLIGLVAGRDTRVFKVREVDGDMALLVCPSCGVHGRALLKDIVPLPVARSDDPQTSGSPPSPRPRCSSRPGKRRKRSSSSSGDT